MNRLNKRVKEGFPAKAGSNVMKKRWEKRAAGFTVALMMMVCLVMTALPAAAAGMTATFTVSPKTISAGDSISATVAVANAAVGTASADVTVQGLGSFGGTYTDNVAFTDGAATINVPTGHISYGGKDSPAYLQIIVGGESVTSQSISGISPIPDDGGDTPTTPPAIAGSLFTIVEGTPVPTIDAGKTAKLTYPIESSKRISGDVQISAKLPDQIYFTAASSTQTMRFSRGEAQNYTFEVSADSSLASGTYPITLEIAYKYSSEARTDTITTYVKVNGSSGEEQKGDLVISGYAVKPTNVAAGSNFQLSVTVRNDGNIASSETLVALSGSSLSTEAFTMNGTLDSMKLPALAPGKSTTLNFSLCSNAKMASGNYILDVAVGEGETASTSKVFIPVTGNPEEAEGAKTESVPQLIIESYSYGDGASSVTGGEIFTLSAVVRNTGDLPVRNVKITISSTADAETGGAFSPANSSNTFFVENIPAGGSITQSIDLLPKADASPKSYGVDVAFSYEALVNDELVSKDLTQTIAIPLVQPDRFEVGEPMMYGPVMEGDSLDGYVTYVNKGKSTIFNLSMKLEGEGFTAAETDIYIGNVESGTSDGYDFSLNPTQAGTITGTLTFTYEDANGETKELVKTFESEVMPMEPIDPMDPGMMDPEIPIEAEAGMPVWGWVAIAAGGVVVLVVAFIVVRKVIRKKKQAALDAEDDYDDDITGA